MAAASTTASCVTSDRVKIREGSTGNSVREAQCRLNTTGAGLTVDSKFGPATRRAVRAFQSSRSLTADGVVGPRTWSALLAATGSSREARVQKVIAFAAAQKGKKYVWGAEGPQTFDCSGLTLRAYQQIGITLPRTSSRQAAAVKKVSASNRSAGDLMHWPGHVGIYAGGGKVWNASRSRGEVALVNVWGSPTYHRVF
ncbi:NlpC/P60 family protein [Streptomyces sp. ITFR-16]|uniref:C40 family peptidase n=1 Tax=Streptomyces sp. ITFR-16 TaxID=3075198 RepID=UPI00288C0796|nr:NlpC/P60 family protein [Streptomyces sp. ITFR-16]WNI21034.1 NlpC/P60 family protein [Streptomyces sp. ITFR-16]